MALRAAAAFLTPIGGARPPSPSDLAWFPVVGLGLGLALGGLWWVSGRAWPAPVAAGLVVTADLGLTGLLHIDGLIDSADGLLPHLSRARRLAVMTEPQVGAFGVSVAVAVLGLRLAALDVMRPHVLVVAGFWCLSRTFMVAVVRWQPYARSEGLVTAFVAKGATAGTGASSRKASQGALPVVLGTVTGMALLVGWHGSAGLAAGGAGVLAAILVVWLARRRIGGFTGDVIGAAGVLLETVGLVVAAARW